MPSLESDCCPTKETPINRPLILSLNSIQPFISERSYRHQLVPCGNNFGNLLFSSAVQRLVQNAARAGRIGVDQRVMQETGADGLVIAAANWLQPKNDYSALASQIEKADVPIVVSGLGAQAIEDRLPELQPGTVRFLKIVSERSASISVRGHFTENLLEHYGITNVDVTGCPSLLWHLDRPARIRCMPDPERPLRISVNATLPGT